uniref:Endonuclease V n=1 Tax=viral metagenome TaxID=1070528 RepID=A0A6C0EAL2_9ZZZZ
MIHDELIQKLIKIQELLSKNVILVDDPRLKEDYDDDLPLPKLVGSLSLSVSQDNPDNGYVALIIYDTEECLVVKTVIKNIDLGNYKALKLTRQYLQKHYPIEESELFPLNLPIDSTSFPYIANFLAFREVEPYAEIILELEPQFMPKLLITEGGGRLHPRKCGLATHLGLLVDIPAIGVAKDLLEVGKWNRDIIKEKVETLLTDDSFDIDYMDEIVGKALKSNNSTRIIYISPGHLISVDTSIKLICELSEFRIPEPLRAASFAAKKARKDRS